MIDSGLYIELDLERHQQDKCDECWCIFLNAEHKNCTVTKKKKE